LYRYPPPRAAGGVAGFVIEFAYCWLQTARLAVRAYARRPFGTLQACNPPDTFFALAWVLRPLGVRFVYDQHDLCPELYRSRFGRPRGAILSLLVWLERATYRTADHVIVTNESYRDVAQR